MTSTETTTKRFCRTKNTNFVLDTNFIELKRIRFFLTEKDFIQFFTSGLN